MTDMPDNGSEPPEGSETRIAYHGTGELVLRLVRGYLLPYKLKLTGAVVCMVLAAASQPLLAWLMEPVVRDIFINRDETMLVLVPLAIMFIMVIGGGANFGQSVLMNWVGLRIVADLQARTFSHVLGLDLAFFRRASTGKLIANLTSDSYLIRQATSSTLTSLVKDLLTVIFLVMLMFYENWRLALVVFFVFPLAAWPISILGQRMRRVVATTQGEIGALTNLLAETFQGVRHVKAYSMEAHEAQRAEKIIDNLFILYMRATRTRALTTPMMEALGGLAIAVVIWYGGSQVIAGEADPGAFFALFTALLLAYRPIRSIANLNTTLQEGLAAAQRVFSVLDETNKVIEVGGARALKVRGGTLNFTDVKFGYAPGVRALRGVTLEVLSGQTVALVGPSGAGKSTLLNLIPRFYDVDMGQICVDSQDIKSVTLASLRSAIALVSQDVVLFDDTIKANIAYGRASATEAEIIEAARSATAHSFVTRLPLGYETVVGERGTRLSGGEKQLVQLARVFSQVWERGSDACLLLDEPMAALDLNHQKEVVGLLSKFSSEGTSQLIVMHDINLAAEIADIIILMSHGRVIGAGPATEVLTTEALEKTFQAPMSVLQDGEQRFYKTVL